jgi:hypothetical protein
VQTIAKSASSFHGARLQQCVQQATSNGAAHLVSPQQAIANSPLQLVPDVQELGNAVLANMISVLFRDYPFKRGSQSQKTLCSKIAMNLSIWQSCIDIWFCKLTILGYGDPFCLL